MSTAHVERLRKLIQAVRDWHEYRNDVLAGSVGDLDSYEKEIRKCWIDLQENAVSAAIEAALVALPKEET